MRADPLFMRNAYEVCGKWGIPLVKKQPLVSDNISLIAYSATKLHDNEKNMERGVHFFVDDYRFSGIYRNPAKSFEKLSQYAFLLTPDYSAYADMNPWLQLESVAHSRWCGAYWQSLGLIVYPTITWSTSVSFEFCFDGVMPGSIVAVSVLGCTAGKRAFLYGYFAMLKRLQPEAIICLGNPFSEMKGNLIVVDSRASRKAVR